VGLQLGQILEQCPAQIFLQVLPQAFNRIQLRTVRRLKQQDDVVGNHEIFGFVKRAVIDLKNVERIRIGLRDLVEKKLVAVTIIALAAFNLVSKLSWLRVGVIMIAVRYT